jgi:O-antigen ligase
MLTSKAGLLSALLCILGGSIAMYKRGGSGRQTLGFGIGTIGLLALFTYLLPAASERIQTAVWENKDQQQQTETHQTTEAVSSTQLRLVTWKASYHTLMEHPFGTGTGDAQEALIQHYQSENQTYAASHKLNSHNQWLQYGTALGWLGMLCFIALLGSAWFCSMKRRTHWFTLLLLLLCMNMLFESMLEVQAGITFFTFFAWVVANRGKVEEVAA